MAISGPPGNVFGAGSSDLQRYAKSGYLGEAGIPLGNAPVMLKSANQRSNGSLFWESSQQSTAVVFNQGCESLTGIKVPSPARIALA
jgi:hypothetical protein